jgi:hypothetical protein
MLSVFPTYVYFFLNGVSAALAYWLIDSIGSGWTGWSATEPGKIIIASGSSMAFLRSSFFNLHIDHKVWSGGPGVVLQMLLVITEKSIDRARSRSNLPKIGRIMKGVDLQRAVGDLPILCLSLMQKTSKEEEAGLGKELAALAKNQNITEETKVLAAGVILSRLTGVKLIEVSINELSKMKESAPTGVVRDRAELDRLREMLRNAIATEESRREK